MWRGSTSLAEFGAPKIRMYAFLAHRPEGGADGGMTVSIAESEFKEHIFGANTFVGLWNLKPYDFDALSSDAFYLGYHMNFV